MGPGEGEVYGCRVVCHPRNDRAWCRRSSTESLRHVHTYQEKTRKTRPTGRPRCQLTSR